MQPAIVRPARTDDEAALAGLKRAIEATHARIQPTFFRTSGQQEAALAVERMLRGAAREHLEALLVAERDGEVCGYAHARIYDTPPSPIMAARRRVHVEEMVVAERCRRAGVGRRLAEAVALWAKRRDAEEVLLTVWHGNEAAEAFYRAIGYDVVSQVYGLEI